MNFPEIFAVVVGYHPKKEELTANIDRYIDYVGRVVVYCNSDEFIPSLAAYGDRITILGEGGGNVGIAKAINEAIRWGYSRGYEFIMTMDQDSYWEEIDSYLESVSKNSDPLDAIFSPHIEAKSGNAIIEHKGLVIQSGAVFRMDFLKQAGLFREDYFIYHVDTEMCQRAECLGYRVIHTGKGKLVHQIACPTRIKGTRYVTENYSPIAYYYITRNSVWLWREYHCQEVRPQKIMFEAFVVRIKHIILGEDRKVAKIYAILKGLLDGVFKNPASVSDFSLQSQSIEIMQTPLS